MKKVICILLALVMVLGLCSCGKKGQTSAKPTSKELTVNESTLFQWLDDSVGMWEFAQRFFDDKIIYKTKLGTWTYQNVDTSLPLSDYNWDNLRHAGPIAGTEWEYYEGTDLKSIKGIDISAYNKVTDWNAVKNDGVEFAMVRVGYRGYSKGGLIEDDRFMEHTKGASEAGVQLGAYFVTQAINTSEAIEEADFVIALLKASGADYTWPIALDLEDAASLDARTAMLSKNERTDIIIAFCDRIKEAGYTPMLYAAIRWYMDEMDISRLTDYNKWFAQYFNRPFFPYEFQMWQYTSSGEVDGVDGNVDLNLCLKNYAEKNE